MNPLIPSIACKSFGEGRALRKCIVYIFSDEPACREGKRFAASEMPRNKCPFLFLILSLVEGWACKKDKREKTPIILSSKNNLKQTNLTIRQINN